MKRLYRAALLALYQVSLLVGIALFPFAVVARRAGIRLPVDRMVERTRTAYVQSANQT
jgi:hypothetical protein